MFLLKTDITKLYYAINIVSTRLKIASLQINVLKTVSNGTYILFLKLYADIVRGAFHHLSWNLTGMQLLFECEFSTRPFRCKTNYVSCTHCF